MNFDFEMTETLVTDILRLQQHRKRDIFLLNTKSLGTYAGQPALFLHLLVTIVAKFRIAVSAEPRVCIRHTALHLSRPRHITALL